MFLYTHLVVLCLRDVSELCPCERWRPLRGVGHLAEGQAHLGVVGERIQRLRDVPLLLSTLHTHTHKFIRAATELIV